MTVWSAQEIETLKELAARGASRTRIAARLKRSTVAVRSMARTLGIEIKSPQQVRKQNGLAPHWAGNRAS